MNRDEQMREVRGLIQEWINAGRRPVKDWLIQELCRKHDNFEGPDRDWAATCCHFAMDAAVRRAFETMKLNPPKPEQGELFPGYKRMQRRYPIQRGGKSVFVRVEHMTDEELEEKAKEHESQGAGHYEHAAEIRKFVVDRRDGIFAAASAVGGGAAGTVSFSGVEDAAVEMGEPSDGGDDEPEFDDWRDDDESEP